MLSQDSPTANADPSYRNVAVTPSNTVNLQTDGSPCRGLYVGVGGDVTVVDTKGNAVTFTAVPSGTFMPVRAKRVNATGTDASSIVALF